MPEYLTDLKWLAYALGGVGLLAECYAYSLQDGRRFRRWSGASALLWSLMYVGLDAATAALTMAMTALRTLVSARWERGRQRWVGFVFFSGLFVLLTVVSWQGWVSLLPAFAVMNTTWALFYLGNVTMRIALLASSVVWIWNDVVWQAWPALVAESLAALISLRTLVRLHRSVDYAGKG